MNYTKWITPYEGTVSKNYEDDVVDVLYIIDTEDHPSGDILPFCTIDQVMYKGVDVSALIPSDQIIDWEDEILTKELDF